MNHDQYDAAVSSEPRPSLRETAFKIVRPLASLQFTVALFVLGMILVFYGTLAQIDLGIWTVVQKYFRSFVVWIPLQLNVKFGSVFFSGIVDEKTSLPGSLPFPGGWLIGLAMLVNLLAAHLVRFKLAWRRTGIIVLHSGVILLLVGELITGQFAVEGNMTIATGQSANYVENLHHTELAVIDQSNPNFDEVTLVNDRRLRKGGTIQDERLPFDVRVDEFMINSEIDPLPADIPSRATKGIGERFKAVSRPEVSGTDTKQSIDFPAAYVTLIDKHTGESLGTYLVSLEASLLRPELAGQEVTVGDKSYRISLRMERTYKPYTIKLEKFEHKLYAGTDKPKDFASTVRLIDPEEGEDREVRIWMNHPLRHRGETLYQQSFLVGDSGTVLQVVQNPGWLIPYVSCLLISGGLIIHFLITLVKFLDKTPVRQRSERGPVSFAESYLPISVVAVVALCFVFMCIPPSAKNGEMDLNSAGVIAVQDGGRIKPLDSVARFRLIVISGKQKFVEGKEDSSSSKAANETTQPAIRWLLDSMAGGDFAHSLALKHKMIRIDNDQLQNMLRLDARPGFQRYSLEEVGPRFGELDRAYQVAVKKNKNERGITDVKVMELHDHLGEYVKILQRNEPGIIPGANLDDKWESLAQADARIEAAHEGEIEAARPGLAEKALEMMPEELMKKGINREMLEEMPAEQRTNMLRGLVARITEGLEQDYGEEIANKYRHDESPQAAAFVKILDAYRAGNAEAFNEAVAQYHQQYDSKISEKTQFRVWLETQFNRVAPFDLCLVLYIMVGVVGALAWLGWTKPLRRSAWGLMILTFVIHTLALIARMYIQGRPPVTNLYSSAVFIGWGGIGLCIVLEAIFRNSIGNVVGAVLGFSTAYIASFLGGSGDSLEMLEAVLDTNLWLATHVTTVTLGYAATMVAGLIAICYLIIGLFTKLMDDEVNKIISQMIYGVVCFAMFLSFTGTVLGGIWADQSWGRFWGWDAKENGAVLVVLSNALILHARWCGLVRSRGMALLAIGGIGITVWSWFGTNQLGAGLHAYGFNKELAAGCRYTWLCCLLLIGIGLIPLKYWRSFTPEALRERTKADARREARDRREASKSESIRS